MVFSRKLNEKFLQPRIIGGQDYLDNMAAFSSLYTHVLKEAKRISEARRYLNFVNESIRKEAQGRVEELFNPKIEYKQEKVSIVLPASMFSLYNGVEKIITSFDFLGINKTEFSKGIIIGEGRIEPCYKPYLQEIIGNELLSSKFGEEFYFDIMSSSVGSIKKRERFLHYSEEPNLYSSLISCQFQRKLEEVGCRVEPQNRVIFGFEELELLDKPKYIETINFLKEKRTRNLYNYEIPDFN